MLDLRTLLVPIDFSDHARAALASAVGLARATQATIHLAHSVHVPIGVPLVGDIAADVWGEVRRGAEQKLRGVEEEVRGAGIPVETHLREGAISQMIVEQARNLGTDLIVMGTRGLSGLQHVLLGSVAERTVCSAPCPVMTVKADSERPASLTQEPMAIRSILVATDFSEHADRALRWAIELAQRFEAKIQLLRAYDAQILAMMPGAISTPTEFWKEVRKAAEAGLKRAQVPIDEAGVESELLLEQRDATTSIVETAKALRVDLIVIGTRGLTGLRRTLLGSTAGRTLRLAPCPVITVDSEEH